jgi:ComF family protein
MRFHQRLVENTLQLFFPSRCSACDELCDPGAAFCRICAISLEPISPGCARCGLPTPQPVARCLGCLARPPGFDCAFSTFEFGGALATAIRRLKWAGRPELARPLASLVPRLPDHDLAIPVPLHPRRLREREFNQAALLALALRPRRLDLHSLVRVRDTRPQASLAPADRRDNVRGAFLADPRHLSGQRVLLVDDVMTTGATADACARALRDAGARAVAVLTVARAVP